MELINQLVSQLGVSQDQAKGGAGLLFKLAKDKLGGDDFAQVKNAIPGLDDLIGAAPESSGAMAALGGLASKFGGGGAAKLAGLAGLAGGFSKLNLDKDMIGKFIPTILDFLKSKGGGAADILAKVLK